MTRRIVRIGGASGFWGDSAAGAGQLVRRARVDYLIFDYLAEITMSIMAKAQKRNPTLGYATDFVDVAMRGTLRDIAEKRIKVIANAGGVNPPACAAALQALAAEMGVALTVAVVLGDDVLPQADALRQAGVTEMFSGASMPEALVSANAYLGAFPIAEALRGGADIVVTGRCVDSALALGPLIHEFGWGREDFDLLAAGSLVGHLTECGVQATGGIHTDWEDVPDWDDIGFPIAECRADGAFVLTKPDGTGGLVTPAVAGEQLIYEIGDPADYRLPDVTCDFTEVAMRQIAPDRVEITGASGRAPGHAYKVSGTYADGFRCSGGFTVVGIDAARKARRAAETVVARTRRMLRDANLGDFDAVEIELLGADSLYGSRARPEQAREVVLRLSVEHREKAALTIFARELAPMGTGGAPGSTGFAGGRPKPQEIVRLFSFLLPKERAPACRVMIGKTETIVPASVAGDEPGSRAPIDIEAAPLAGSEIEVPLSRLAWARSGDKGDVANIGVLARTAALLPVLAREVTATRVAGWFEHLIDGDVKRFAMPGTHAFNFVLDRALGGGGMASLRNDPQGKSYAQLLLAMPVRVAPELLPRPVSLP